MGKLPKYKITIDNTYAEDGEDLGISKIAFTKRPAIMTKGMAFSSDIKPLYFSDDLKYRICAPAMIPMEIYRNDDEEYYVEFTVEEIEDIHSKFMSGLNNKDLFNLEHNNDEIVPAYILEAWIVDEPKSDKAFTKFGIEVPKGTLMLTTQVTDKEYYKELVESGQTGFSIEGFLGLKLSEVKPPYHDNCMCEMVDGEVVSEPNVCEYCLEQSKYSIDKKNNELKMEKVNLPAGEYPIGEDKILIVAEDDSISIKEIEVETLSSEEVKEDEIVKEEELSSEEVKEEAIS